MKTKLISAFLLLFSINVQSQETDSLWHSFRLKLDKFVIEERARYYFGDSNFAYHLAKSIINTDVERKAVIYLFETFKQDTLPNVREFVSRMMEEIALRSNDSISRKKAIHYILDTSLTPNLFNLYLKDFDDSIKQKIMHRYKRKPSKELSFLVETEILREMKANYTIYDKQISDSIIKYNNTKSYKEIKYQIYQEKVSMRTEDYLKARPSNRIIIISGQLHLEETIPYLKEFANNEKYNDAMRRCAVFALATMRIEDFEDRAVVYFDIDTDRGDIGSAELINSQKIWYAYMSRLKSQKYKGRCPVAYCTITRLGNVLKDFPVYEWIELADGKILFTPVPLVPDECRDTESVKKVPINPDHITLVVGWMEANKGKYELQRIIDKTF